MENVEVISAKPGNRVAVVKYPSSELHLLLAGSRLIYRFRRAGDPRPAPDRREAGKLQAGNQGRFD
jgi:hypothetical protein